MASARRDGVCFLDRQAEYMGEIIPLREGAHIEPVPQVRTFLIADIRGYTAFTQERGDEAAALLAGAFARLTRQGVQTRGGEVLELRGDEALAVFTSPRQALRAAIDLQDLYAEHSEQNPGEPLYVGIGLDAGEAVPVEGGYRGSALNMAARLCGAALAGEILATEAISHLAGTVDGITYADGGMRPLKGMQERVRVVRVLPEGAEPADVVAPVSFREPTFPYIADFTRGMSAMLGEHLRDVNQQVQQELAQAFEETRAEFGMQRARTPSTAAVPELRNLGRSLPGHTTADLRRQPRGERTSSVPWIVAALLLAVVVIVALILWTHFL